MKCSNEKKVGDHYSREHSTVSRACWSSVPGFLQPLVEGIGMLGELLSEFIVLFLSPLFLL